MRGEKLTVDLDCLVAHLDSISLVLEEGQETRFTIDNSENVLMKGGSSAPVVRARGVLIPHSSA